MKRVYPGVEKKLALEFALGFHDRSYFAQMVRQRHQAARPRLASGAVFEIHAGDAAGHRENLGRYSAPLLDQLIGITAAGTLIVYAISTLSPETIEKFGSGQLGLTLPFPAYGIFRYLYLVYQKDGGGSPAEALVTDRPLLLCVGLWGLAVITIIYAGPLPL